MCSRSLLTAVILLLAFIGKAQNTISGNIVTKDGEPAPNVNIELKELRRTCISDLKGHFAISDVSDGSYHILVSFIGLTPQEQKISVQQNENVVLSFVLTENASELAEVIVSSRKGLNNQVASVGKVAY
jgi:iron complex outermembrane receptor protein